MTIVLVYFLITIFYYLSCREAIKQRIKFSVFSIADKQGMLSAFIVLFACLSGFSGAQTLIKDQGFQLPNKYVRAISGTAINIVSAKLPENTDQDALDQMHEEIYTQINKTINELIQPRIRFIPFLLAFMVYGLLSLIVRIVSFLPLVLLRLVLSLFIWMGLAKIITEPVQAERIVSADVEG
jgi:hypothetical protein